MKTEESKDWLLKLLKLLRDFKTPIQLGALSLVVFYLVIAGSYDEQTKIILAVAIVIILLIPSISQWKKTEHEAEVQKKKIDADVERGRDWTHTTQDGMIERTRIEAMQRKQGALDVYEKIIALIEERIEKCKLDRSRVAERESCENLRMQISYMKNGLENFPVGFHEQVERERKGRRGRLALIPEAKSKTKREKKKENKTES